MRHLVMNMIRGHRSRFGKKYGEIVLCCDGGNYWRKEVFPLYKGTRAKKGERDPIWEHVYSWMNNMLDDFKEYLPYKVVQVRGAEGDDIIGHLARKYHAHEPIMIVSEDKDFKQLQRYPGVVQYAPQKHKFLKENNPIKFLREHIIRGDSGDGIPNIFSSLDTLMDKDKSQVRIYKKKIEPWLEMTPEEFCKDSGVSMKRYVFQRMLIDLEYVPNKMIDKIDNEYESYIVPEKTQLLQLFMKHKMRHMMECMDEFLN